MLATTNPMANRSEGMATPLERKLSRGSFLSTIKNLVAAPLSWFSPTDDFEGPDELEGTPGKRRRALSNRVSPNKETSPAGDPRAAKRMRVDGPERQVHSGYLDPPASVLHPLPPPPRAHSPSPQKPRVQSPPRSPMKFSQRKATHHRTLSPMPNRYAHPKPLVRTMSVDPPHFRSISRDATITSLPSTFSIDTILEASAARTSSPAVPRDMTMSPTRSSLRLRSSLTPQPSGSSFGPALYRRERESSDAPPMTTLMSNPSFVKPPTEAEPTLLSTQPTVTLGSLVELEPNIRRQYPSAFLSSQFDSFSDTVTSKSLRSYNSSEKALHELDVYKTPLLPSRLRGANNVPDMFKSKRIHVPVLMSGEADDTKSRFGSQKKSKEVNGTKPYAGTGGMRKLLARRKMEEGEDRKEEKAISIDEIELEEQRVGKPSSAKEVHQELVTFGAEQGPSVFEPLSAADSHESSSLRVGRTRTSRSHIDRPASRPRNRFSALYNEDEDDDLMAITPTDGNFKTQNENIPEQSDKKRPAYAAPSGFSFARAAPPIEQDTDAKEPPIPALPFSLKASVSSASTEASKSGMPAPKQTPLSIITQPTLVTQKTSSASDAEAPTATVNASGASSVGFLTKESETSGHQEGATPAMTSTVKDKSSNASSVPNFFANSSVFSKPKVSLPSSLFSSEKGKQETPAGTTNTPNAASVNGVSKSLDADNAEVKTPSSDAFKLSASSPAFASFSNGNNKSSSGAQASSFMPPSEVKVSSPSLFGTNESNVPASKALSNSSESSAISEKPQSFFSAKSNGSKPSEAALSSAFGTPSKSPESATSVQQTTSFFPLKGDGSKTTESVSASGEGTSNASPLFGKSASTPVFGGFGTTSAPATTSTPKPAFAFGQSGPSALTGPSANAAKSSFGSTDSVFGKKETTAAVEKKDVLGSAFAFGAAPSTTPVAAKTFNFGASAAPASNSGDAVGSKPFTFGSRNEVRTVTPPREQEMKMDESPIRDTIEQSDRPKPRESFTFDASNPLFGQDSRTSPAPFTFATSAQATSAFPFAQKPSESPATPSTPFPFPAKPLATNGSASTGAFFGQKAPEPLPNSQSTYTFGKGSSTPTAAPFQFGTAPSNNSGPFGQPVVNTSSAPNSPSTFNQPNPFNFSAPGTTAFGYNASQPASPAPTSAGLPQSPSTPGGFPFSGSGAPTAQQSTTPFGAPPAAPPLFTIGSAPAPTTGPGGRNIKKLPSRRTTKR